MGDLTITYGFFWPCNENRHRQYVFYGLKTVYVQSCGILTPYEIFLGYVGQINQLTLTQPAPLLHRADGAWLDMSLVSSATRKRWTNCFLRVIPTLQDYSDIASDVPSGSIYIYGIFILTFLAYTLTFFLAFYLASILTFFLAFYLIFFLQLRSCSAGARGWSPAVPTDLELAVEGLRSGVRCWVEEGWKAEERKGKEGRKEMKEGRGGGSNFDKT